MAAPLGNQLIGLGLPAPLANAMTANVAQLVAVPASATAAGSPGQYAVASGFVYFCVSANVWQRGVIATW